MHRHTRDRLRSASLVRSRALEERYARQLRKIAQSVGMIVRTWQAEFDGLDLSRVPRLKVALDDYAKAVTPWAKATASRMVEEIAIKENRSWAAHAQAMSLSLRKELQSAPIRETMQSRINEQIADITSIPQDAATRVYDLTLKGIEDSQRASSYVADIMRSGQVSIGRANMLARTAVSTTMSTLTESRALWIGSPGYIWRGVLDESERPSHRKMEGVFVEWSKPPTLDGYTAHAGCYANCRCSPFPVIPEF